MRAAYLMSGATDVAAETRDGALLAMLDRVWRNTTERNLYLTGGIGPSAQNGKGSPPITTCRTSLLTKETCASVAVAQWNHRLALLYGDARYADVFERSLYNGALAGMSLDGTRFFYVNPLASAGRHHRQEWFGCACCPPNICRTIASLGAYAYAFSDDGFWVNLYIQGTASARLQGQEFNLDVATDYPWDGKVVLRPRLERPAKLGLRLRVPGWCRGASVSIDQRRIPNPRLDAATSSWNAPGTMAIGSSWTCPCPSSASPPIPTSRPTSARRPFSGVRWSIASRPGPG